VSLVTSFLAIQKSGLPSPAGAHESSTIAELLDLEEEELKEEKGEVSSRRDFKDDGGVDDKTTAAASSTNTTTGTTRKINDLLCKATSAEGVEWGRLYSENFVTNASRLLLDGDDINIVQIGAHVGFEANDPIAKGLSSLLDKVDAAAALVNQDKNEIRKRFHWTFVEPSPPNFKRLSENLIKYSNVCDMHGINAGVVSDSVKNSTGMPFYSVRDTIDPETGYDSLSGKTLPAWITQVSSFRIEPLLRNRGIFRMKGLDLADYIVETTVVTKSYSDLMQEAAPVGDKKMRPFLVLIDTEGFDCEIVKGISPSSRYLPTYLLFEHKQCADKEGVYNYLKSLGYDVYPVSKENTIAVKKEASE